MRGVDLSECRLSFCDFTDADVAGAIFHGSDLYRSTLHRALNVTFAYLTGDQRHYLEQCRQADETGEFGGPNLFSINKKIRNATTFQGAKTQFASIIEQGLRPDRYSAGLLVRAAVDPLEAWEALEIVEDSGAPVSDVLFTSLAAKMTTAAQVRQVIAIMRARGVPPSARVYNTLLAREKARQEYLAILSEMDAEGIRRDNVTYEILMRRTDFPGRKDLLQQLIESDLQPGTAELNLLLRASRNEDEADEAIELGNELELPRDADTYALLAPHKARQSAFRVLLDDMIEDEIVPDSRFYGMAIGRSQFSEACFLYGRMRANGIAANRIMYKHFAKLADLTAESLDPAEDAWPEDAIESLIRQNGRPTDLLAAGLKGHEEE